jgi:hypothetical protein
MVVTREQIDRFPHCSRENWLLGCGGGIAKESITERQHSSEAKGFCTY